MQIITPRELYAQKRYAAGRLSGKQVFGCRSLTKLKISLQLYDVFVFDWPNRPQRVDKTPFPQAKPFERGNKTENPIAAVCSFWCKTTPHKTIKTARVVRSEDEDMDRSRKLNVWFPAGLGMILTVRMRISVLIRFWEETKLRRVLGGTLPALADFVFDWPNRPRGLTKRLFRKPNRSSGSTKQKIPQQRCALFDAKTTLKP